MLKDIRNLLNGSMYGMTLVIPGVSATILAIILGFYDGLIHTMNHFREDVRKSARYMAAFLFGVAVGTVLFSRLITFLIDSFSLPTMLFFVGLLAGIVPLTYAYAKGAEKRIAPREIALAAIAMVGLYFLSTGFTGPEIVPADSAGTVNISVILVLFVAGIVNGATLVIPGLSGAFILLVMGLYPVIISTVSDIGTFLADPRNLELFFEICLVLAPFGIGALIGVLFMARLMEKLLRDYHKQVYAVIMGLVIASIVTLFQNPIVYQSGTSAPSIIAGAALCIAGFAIAFFLGKKAK
ncbi:MAG: DUF368 domain-containing protein [Oscillospiraceae bacterium]|nr:DUF368 domain-containing protein [Oscillospiraceae bacterium]MCL2228141.1 DUF368 domain-containing protein [Oscillospiraceae bacterium]